MSADDHRYVHPKEGPASCTGCDWKSRPIGISSLTQYEEHYADEARRDAAEQPAPHEVEVTTTLGDLADALWMARYDEAGAHDGDRATPEWQAALADAQEITQTVPAPTAADQPTTEPSEVERAAAALYFEDCGVAPDDMVRRSEEYDTSFRAPAQVLADAGLLAPAPQPAADTETEDSTRWYAAAWRAQTGNFIPVGPPTVVREHAQHRVDHADPDGYPDGIFLVTRIEHPWEEA